LDIDITQGFKPKETSLGCELGLVHKGPWLLSTGFINWSTNGERPQPFLEAGYYSTHLKLIAGSIEVHNRFFELVGLEYDFSEHWKLLVDYLSGKDNFTTAGLVWGVTDNFEIDTSIFFSNRNFRNLAGAVTFSYTFPLWRAKQ
jgi:hypothetical protein